MGVDASELLRQGTLGQVRGEAAKGPARGGGERGDRGGEDDAAVAIGRMHRSKTTTTTTAAAADPRSNAVVSRSVSPPQPRTNCNVMRYFTN